MAPLAHEWLLDDGFVPRTSLALPNILLDSLVQDKLGLEYDLKMEYQKSLGGFHHSYHLLKHCTPKLYLVSHLRLSHVIFGHSFFA